MKKKLLDCKKTSHIFLSRKKRMKWKQKNLAVNVFHPNGSVNRIWGDLTTKQQEELAKRIEHTLKDTWIKAESNQKKWRQPKRDNL